MENVDEAVLTTLRSKVLKPAIIDAVITGVKDAMKPASITREIARRESEIATIDHEIGRLTEAIASSATSLPTLLEALQARQRRRDELTAATKKMTPIGKQRDVKAIEAEAREKLNAWRALLTRQTQDGRELLRQVLMEPLRFTPEEKMYRFRGKAALGRLLVGAVPTCVASLTGFEPVLPP
jgi:hypothetical protein